MNDSFCRKIDKELLIDKYISGELSASLIRKLEKHIQTCEKHARAVTLEKMIKKGVTEYARNGMKARLRGRIQKRTDTRSMILRFAAILFIATITPLILYYHLNIDKPVNISKKSEQISIPAPSDQMEAVKESKACKPAASPKKEQAVNNFGEKSMQERKLKRSIGKGDEKKQQPVVALESEDTESETQPLKDIAAGMKKSESIKDLQGSSGYKDLPSPAMTGEIIHSTSGGGVGVTEGNSYQQPESISKKAMRSAGNAVSMKEDIHQESDLRGITPDMLSTDKVSKPSHTVILKQLSLYNDEVYDCFAKYYGVTDGDSLLLDIRITVGKNGIVDEVNILHSTIKNEEFNNCIIDKIKSINFSPQVEKVSVKNKYVYKISKQDTTKTAEQIVK